MKAQTKRIFDRWLDEMILCGYTYPISRRQAHSEMVAEGWDAAEAANCLCYYKALAAA